MNTIRVIAIILIVITGLDSLRRFIFGRSNSWTYVFEAGVFGAALGVLISNSPGTAVGTALGGFVFFAVAALLFDTWLAGPRRHDSEHGN